MAEVRRPECLFYMGTWLQCHQLWFHQQASNFNTQHWISPSGKIYHFKLSRFSCLSWNYSLWDCSQIPITCLLIIILGIGHYAFIERLLLGGHRTSWLRGLDCNVTNYDLIRHIEFQQTTLNVYTNSSFLYKRISTSNISFLYECQVIDFTLWEVIERLGFGATMG